MIALQTVIWYYSMIWLLDFLNVTQAYEQMKRALHRFSPPQAIDSFGNRYLLGVFENKADAEKAFDSWNKEYEQAWWQSIITRTKGNQWVRSRPTAIQDSYGRPRCLIGRSS